VKDDRLVIVVEYWDHHRAVLIITPLLVVNMNCEFV